MIIMLALSVSLSVSLVINICLAREILTPRRHGDWRAGWMTFLAKLYLTLRYARRDCEGPWGRGLLVRIERCDVWRRHWWSWPEVSWKPMVYVDSGEMGGHALEPFQWRVVGPFWRRRAP